MKIALVYSGQPRYYNQSIHSQIISTGVLLSKGDILNIHAFLWIETKEEFKESLSHFMDSIEKTARHLKCKVNLIDLNALKYNQGDSMDLFDNCDSSSIYSMYYGIMESTCGLISSCHKFNLTYDVIIRTRTDMAFCYCFDMKAIKEIVDMDKVVTQEIPSNIAKLMGGKNYINDQVFFANLKVMKKISAAYFALNKGVDLYKGCYNSETFLYRYFELSSIECHTIPVLTSVQREEMINPGKKSANVYIKLKARMPIIILKSGGLRWLSRKGTVG